MSSAFHIIQNRRNNIAEEFQRQALAAHSSYDSGDVIGGVKRKPTKNKKLYQSPQLEHNYRSCVGRHNPWSMFLAQISQLPEFEGRSAASLAKDPIVMNMYVDHINASGYQSQIGTLCREFPPPLPPKKKKKKPKQKIPKVIPDIIPPGMNLPMIPMVNVPIAPQFPLVPTIIPRVPAGNVPIVPPRVPAMAIMNPALKFPAPPAIALRGTGYRRRR